MAWVKLDDAILDNPKILRAGFIGFGVHVAGITFAGRNLTDGFVPFEKVATLVDLSVLFTNLGCPLGTPRDEIKGGAESPDVYGVVDRLVEIGLWHEVRQGGALIGYQIHDYLEYNPSREHVLARRDKERAKKQKSRATSPRESPGESVGNPRPPVPVPVPVPKKISLPSGVRSRSSQWPADFTLTEARGAVADQLGLDAAAEWGKFKDHAHRDGVVHKDWDAAWRYWCRRGAEMLAQRKRGVGWAN